MRARMFWVCGLLVGCSQGGVSRDGGGAGPDAAAFDAAAGAGAVGAAGAGGGAVAGHGGAGPSTGRGGMDAAISDARGGAGAAGLDARGAVCEACASYGTPALLGHVATTALAELSGVTASWANPGVLFAHNDRNRAVVYALSRAGALLATYQLEGAPAMDIEDVGIGPCPQGTCVVLADIGGNLSASRTEFGIFRFAEPRVTAEATSAPVTVAFERFRFAYEDGANHNAEGLLVEPRSGALYVVTKVAAGQPSAVYRLPHPLVANVVNRAMKLADLPVPRAGDMPLSAAAAHPCGLGFVVRTYNAVYEFRIPAGASFDDAFRATPTALPAANEPQSEGITYEADGRGYVSSGEGAGAPIYGVGCR